MRRVPVAYTFPNDVIPYKVKSEYFQEYIGGTPLIKFMGSTAFDPIQLFDMNSGDGSSFRVTLKKNLDYQNPVMGFDVLAGSEQEIQFYSDIINIDQRRFADKLTGVSLVKQVTPIKVYDALKPSLMDVQQQNLTKSVFDSACASPAQGGLYTVGNVGAAGNGPQEDRVLYAGTAYNAAIYTTVGNMGNATYDAAGLSVKAIRQAKTMAVQGGTVYEREPKIKPAKVMTKHGFPEEKYILLIDPNSYLSLITDPAWSQFVYRGMIDGKSQPEALSGSRFRGEVEGVEVYECPELIRYRVTGAGPKVAAWNLFMGAQAFGVVWAKRPWFSMEQRDYGNITGMAVAEIRGQKAFQFQSYANAANKIERGIIHLFSRIS
jgi:Protein of unknown function (DUF4043)